MAIRFKKIEEIKTYLPPKKKWVNIMKDDSIDIEKKILLNGLRYVYVSNMIEDIRKDTSKRKLKIIPTGSKNLSSDIDIQITLNFSSNVKVVFFKYVIDMIIKHIKIADKIWGEFPTRLDVNFYPFGLFNFVNSKISYDGLSVSKNGNNCCWIPVLDNQDLTYQFLKRDIKRINKKYKPNLQNFYNFYKENITESFFALYNNFKNNIIDPEEHNNLILDLTKHNEIGPEMYFSVGSIIFVVWYIQMGNELPPTLKKYLSIPSYLENNRLYKETGKEKYKIRSEISKENMDKKMLALLDLV